MVKELNDKQKEKCGYNESGVYIGNKNTKVFHHSDCFDVLKMKEENKIPTLNSDALYRPCAHCTPDLTMQRTLDYLFKLEKHAIPCVDDSILEMFEEVGCKADRKHDGQVLMYPDHQKGTKVHGKPGLWHVYLKCTCGVVTSFRQAKVMLKVKGLVKMNIHEKIRYGTPLMDRKTEIRELMAVVG
jgi:hypothetical protein